MTGRVSRTILLGAAGLAAGVVNGLLGAGGGIIAVWALNWALGKHISDRRDSFANALVTMLPVSAVSAVGYGLRGLADSRELGILVVPALLGGFCGALILDKIDIKWLRMIFAGVIIYSGVSMLFR